jgi:DNA modification methylase
MDSDISSITALHGECILDIVNGVQNTLKVSELTHCFYRYPARFSPLFARGIIKAFTKPGDLVLDPFMGGGTALVEACSLGRTAIGTDISSLATFISRIKTLLLSDNDFYLLNCWISELPRKLNIFTRIDFALEPNHKYLRNNLTRRATWRIRKLINLSIESTNALPKQYLRDYARCVILATAQWGLDCRRELPSVAEFRDHLLVDYNKMILGSKYLAASIEQFNNFAVSKKKYHSICIRNSAENIDKIKYLQQNTPKLILTSPPYPGVHVLYHRWQIQSRRETPAPFWIANCQDGTGSSHYTFGDRKQKGLSSYFNNLINCFSSIAKICDKKTLIVQIVGFSDASWQLPIYLDSMAKVGLREVIFAEISNSYDDRLWRGVPNRKWYAENKNVNSSAKEVVLFHRLK